MDIYMNMKLIALLSFLQTLTYVQGYELKYIGCFKDQQFPNRALSVGYKKFFGNSVEYCARICGYEGYKYFGLAKGYQCWCGNSGYDRYGPSRSCFYPCSGKFEEICGGRYRNSVYEIVYPPTPVGSTTRSLTLATEAVTTSLSTTPTSIAETSTTTTTITIISPTKTPNIRSRNLTIPRQVTRRTSNVTNPLTLPSQTPTTIVRPKHLTRLDSSPPRVYSTTPAGNTKKLVTSSHATATTSQSTTTTSINTKPRATTSMSTTTPIQSLNTTTPTTVIRSTSNMTILPISSPATTVFPIPEDTSTSQLPAPKSSAPGDRSASVVLTKDKGTSVYIGIRVGAVAGCAMFVLVVVQVVRRCSRKASRRDCAMELEELQASPSHARGCDESVIPAVARAGALRYDNGVYNACSYSIRPQRAKRAIYSQAECTVLATSTDH